MKKPLLLFPKDVQHRLAKQYARQHRCWLEGQQVWPVTIPLGTLKETALFEQPDIVQDWVRAWRSWQGPGELIWCERQFRTFGQQSLPEKILFNKPEEVTSWLDETPRWQRAVSRYHRLIERWPSLAYELPYHFKVLTDYSEADFKRLESILGWLEANPGSALYPRQLPIAGLDSKWLENHKPVVAKLMNSLQGDFALEKADFFQRWGLKKPPHPIRMRILDPALRGRLGGIGDIATPSEDLAKWDFPISQVFIVENLQTGLAFEDIPGTVVLMALGYSVDTLAMLPWLRGMTCIYWGDIDTHGFAIVSRARHYLPHMKTILMDETTLLQYNDLWAEEQVQHPATELPYLTDAEQQVYSALKQQKWGNNIRLEQERVLWSYAWQIIRSKLSTE